LKAGAPLNETQNVKGNPTRRKDEIVGLSISGWWSRPNRAIPKRIRMGKEKKIGGQVNIKKKGGNI